MLEDRLKQILSSLLALAGLWTWQPAAAETQISSSAFTSIPALAADSAEPHADEGKAPANGYSETKRPSTPTQTAAVNPATNKATRDAAYQRMLELKEQNRYPEAVASAQRVLELSEQVWDEDDIELVAPLNNLATMQMYNADYEAAEKNYLRSISLITRRHGILSPRLINTYVGLGATYHRAELFEQAERAFAKALRVNHVNEGFYNFDQLEIRDHLTEAYIGLAQLDDASFHQEAQLEIHQRKLGPDDLEITPALHKLGQWYERIDNHELARDTYRRERRLLVKHYGKDHPAQIDALLGIASSLKTQGLMSQSAVRLKDALLLSDNHPDGDQLQTIDILVKLGDIYTSDRKPNTALTHYQRAWAKLSADENYAAKRDEYFANPVRVAGVPWRALQYAPDTNPRSAKLENGHVLVTYNVSETGRPRDVEVIESDPPGLMDQRVKRNLAQSYYRPAFADGMPVEMTQQLFRHDFLFSPALAEGETKQPPKRRTDGPLERPET